DPGVLQGALQGHADAVWALAFNPRGDLLASCSADGSLRLWQPRGHQGPALATFQAQRGEQGPQMSPRSPPDPRWPQGHPQGPQISWRCPQGLGTSPWCPPAGGSSVNQVVAHPSQPLSITASDDHSIRVLDNRTGGALGRTGRHWGGLGREWEGVGGTGGHWEGSHDCSLRLWHLGQCSCVQELPAHRRKHSEAVLAVAFHCLLPLAASAGADGLAKVFV
ncbi:STRN4 protein, partial [Indicator maculatus]|nr:STRN4 protein [Indicator maculatus]